MTDPLLSLHSDLFDLIFQHLSWTDIAESSTVSSLWYNATASSPNCMRKLTFSIRHSSQATEHVDLEMATRIDTLIDRRYRNIYADFSHQKTKAVLHILAPKERKWKSVQLLNENFVDGSFFSYFNEKIEFLELSRISCDRESNGWSFPNLLRLKVFSCNGALVSHLMKCASLKELVVCETIEGSAGAKFADLIVLNKRLTTLTIFSPNYRSFLPMSINARAQFTLRKLVIDDSLRMSSTEEDRECLQSFLRNQSGSLEVVDINLWCGSEILDLCFRMPQLKDFSCNVKEREENIDWTRVNLEMNESIKRLHVRDVRPRESASFYDKVFSHLPNLQVYKSKYMHSDDLMLLSHRCKQIEELYIEAFNVSWLPSDNCFPKLRAFKSWDIDDDLTNTLTTKGAKNRFEELILDQ